MAAFTHVHQRAVALAPEMQRLAYSLVGDDHGRFEVVACDGRIRVKRGADVLDYEATNAYSLTLGVADDGEPPMNATLSGTALVSIFWLPGAPSR